MMARRRKRPTALEHAERTGRWTPLSMVAVALVHGDYVGISPNPYYRLNYRTQKDVMTIMMYQAHIDLQRRRPQAPMRRAKNLLRGFLNPEQREQFERRGWFRVTGSAGGTYRVERNGHVEKISKHGTRWYPDVVYCYHESGDPLPGCDRAIGIMLLLQADEPAFLAEANATVCNETRWNGEWMRDVRDARACRQREQQEGAA